MKSGRFCLFSCQNNQFLLIFYRFCLLCAKRNLMSQQVFKSFTLTDELSFSVYKEHFRGAIARIIVAGHSEAVSACVIKGQDISFSDFGDTTVWSEGIGLTDITHHRIKTLSSFRVGDVVNVMLRTVKHRPDQVVETAVHLGKNGRSGLFYYVDIYQKFSGGAYQNFPGSKASSRGLP